MSRKRGKKQKGTEPRVEAVPDDILAEGSGPVARADEDAVATVDDVVTTDDIATTEDVITPDDVVATPSEPEAAVEPEPEPEVEAAAEPKAKGKRKKRKAATAPDAEAGDISDEALPAPAPMSADSMSNAEAAELIEAAVRAAEPAEASEGEPDDSAPARAAVDGGEVPEGDGEAGEGEGDEDAEGDEDDEDSAGVFPTSATSMDSVQLKHLVESLVFASDKPLTVPRLRQLTRCADARRLELALTELTEDYKDRGVVLQQVSGGYQFRTRTQFSAWVQQLIAGRPVRLSRAQLETLAIIAYRQPITRPEIDDIRGVDSTATLKLLLDRMLIRALGKREEVGRPTLYGTTKEFLDFFSLGDLRELPTLREYSELSAESRKVMSERLGIPDDEVPSAPAPELYEELPKAGGEGAATADADELAAFYAAADAVERSDAEAERDDDEPPTKRSLDDLAARFAERADDDDDEDEDDAAAEEAAAPPEAEEAAAPSAEASGAAPVDEGDSLSLDDLAVDLDDEAPASLAVEQGIEAGATEAAVEADAPVADEVAAADGAAALVAEAEAAAPAEEAEAAAEGESPVAEGREIAAEGESPVAEGREIAPEGESPVAEGREIAPEDDRPVERPAMETRAFEATSLDDATGEKPDANPHDESGD